MHRQICEGNRAWAVIVTPSSIDDDDERSIRLNVPILCLIKCDNSTIDEAENRHELNRIDR